MRNDIELSYIIPVYFNQKNTKVLDNLLKHYSGYDPEILSKIEFVIVDDCSPLEVKISKNVKLNFQLFRITTDITWNQAGARNLGVTYASAAKIILADCDHCFPELLFRQILKSNIPRRTLFKFKREDACKNKINSAYNIFYTSKSVFFAALGYDEEFCGNYGHEDSMFRIFQRKIGNRIRYFSWTKKIVVSNVDAVCSYHNLVRDTHINQLLMGNKLKLMQRQCLFAGHGRQFLNFDYRKVTEKWI